jgi:hypothetical protein
MLFQNFQQIFKMTKPLPQLLFVSTISFILVSYFLQTYENIFTPNFELSDCQSYRNAAHFLYFENGKPHPTRPPLFPFFVGIPSLFSNSELFCNVFIMFFNFLCHLLTLFFLFKTLVKIVNSKTAFYLSLLFALNISSIVINNQTLTEPLYTLSLTLIVYFIQKYFYDKSIKNLFGAYLILCLSILIRPSLLPMFWVSSVIIFINILFFAKQKILKIAFFLIPLSILGFQMKHMNDVYGKPTVSFIGELAYFTYLTPYATEYDQYPDWQSRSNAWQIVRHERMKLYEQKDTFSTVNWVSLTDFAQNELNEMLVQKPKSLLITYAHHIISNAFAYSMLVFWLENKRNEPSFNTFKKIALNLTRCQNMVYSSMILIVFPILFLFKKTKKEEKLLITTVGFIGLFIITISGISITQGDRFHIVFVPLALVILSFLIKHNFKKRSL